MTGRLFLMLAPLIIFLFSGSVKYGERVDKYDFSSVDKYIEQNIAAYNNHVAVLITQNDEVIYRKEVNMTVNTNYGIASASKWLSAGVIMALVDERKLSLDDTIGKFLPLFSTYHKGNITIRQLFSHTAGFGGDAGSILSLSRKFEYRSNITLAQAVDSIAVHTALVNAPGTKFNYGSTSMQIGGGIAEVVSGKTWQQLFDEKIAQPCQMRAVYLQLSIKNPLLAGGVSTSAADYINFLVMIANRGTYKGKRVLSENAINIMTSDQTRKAVIQRTPYSANPYTKPVVASVKYGVGNWLDVVDAAGNVVESSSPGLFGAHPWQDSKHHVAGIIFTKTSQRKSNAISLKIRQMVREIIEKG
ncbi:serine hydrolase domain-containing protein [Mucilaginibacter sp. HD30]